jgi:threonyl-tRNA synthetase
MSAGMIKVKLLPEGKMVEIPSGATIADLSKAEGITTNDPNTTPLAALVNGTERDLATPLANGDAVQFLAFADEVGRKVLWHSAAHLLAAAVTQLYPGTKCAIGPAIDQGFYYDFEFPVKITDEDLPRIHKAMVKLAEQRLPFIRTEHKAKELISEFKLAGDTYKQELAEEHQADSPTLSTYTLGEFTDLCRGPHVSHSGYLRFTALLNLAGAYWRGDEHNIMLTRIYGIAYPTKQQVEERLTLLEEIKKRDHRLIARRLDLYTICDDAGAGLVFWHPRGARLIQLIEEFWHQAHRERGYQLVRTPHIARGKLWEQSGHLGFYRENMYLMTIDEEEYALKPMNCPGHVIIYQSRTHSYRDLPLKLCELGTVYRYERSGTLHGLLRVRGFTQDDAHIFCTPEQIKAELHKVCELVEYMMGSFGFKDYIVEISVRDATNTAKYAGSDADWVMAEGVLTEVATERNYRPKRMEGEAVFYGPKIDFKLLDALGRAWQGPTVQFDFNLPGRLGVTYVGEDGAEHLCYMIHRTVLGSMERFIAGLLEHTAGALPLFVCPVQVVILPVTLRDETLLDYAAKVHDALAGKGLRVEVDLSEEKLGKKIRAHEEVKIPFMLVLGQKEMAEGMVSVRERGEIEHGAMTLEEFVGMATT